VPQAGHVPLVAGLPFFILMEVGFFISFLARHFIQYACIPFLLSFILAMKLAQNCVRVKMEHAQFSKMLLKSLSTPQVFRLKKLRKSFNADEEARLLPI
jgi:hypothetical protein